ncbi:hypothetical protein LOC68_12075 [Blastopirellula sp. JC732]|uniref:Uncharacterized protein n=1 Tax=Blastopirellula sediminis TaxID=2894196 RepID=A0A9X1MLP4_9BACT|nr:hypothetical protein [Blastopirellula sediminis]MCC9607571.1 hypothetical protein [Blastopirellula sediminis]MCC9629136.1 hypothetical protein [Blastopirellula sediminis]
MTSAELAADEMEPAAHAAELDPRAAAITSKLCWGIFLQTLAIGLVCVSSVGLHFEGLDRLVMTFAAISSLANFAGIVLAMPGISWKRTCGFAAIAMATSVIFFCFGAYIETAAFTFEMTYIFVSLLLQATLAAVLSGTVRLSFSLIRRDATEPRSHFSLLTLMMIVSGVALLSAGARPLFVRMRWTSYETVTHGAIIFLILCGGGALAGLAPSLAACWRSRRIRWLVVLVGVAATLGIGFLCQIALEWATSGRVGTTTWDWNFCLVIQFALTTIGLGPLLFGGGSSAAARKSQNWRYAIAIALPMVATFALLLLTDPFDRGQYDYVPLVESLALATVGLLAIVATTDAGEDWLRVFGSIAIAILYSLAVGYMVSSSGNRDAMWYWMRLAVFQFVLMAMVHHGVRSVVRREPMTDFRYRMRFLLGFLVVILLLGSLVAIQEFWQSIYPRMVLLSVFGAILPMFAFDSPDLRLRRLALFATVPAALLLASFNNALYELATRHFLGAGPDDKKRIAAAVIGQTVILTIAILPLIWAPERVESNEESADAVGEISAEN